ncbi:haloacid dehalogenase-like hydrolase domain-containing protein 2 [Irpex rosettiformis]|uniref:Haloacid dehalogenase-like hydrolase domain-containing protein 2 n=1 Tax=Irpex rosettiformis TaxID=378272 RepID=A0ACB8UF35_9APHY|nr:haloacid dehalogenase-like hydrolase domain-containing protein 2 [Irpex rosettiformis]
MATGPRPPIRALLIDLSGTLHVGSTPTPHAVDALSQLRRHNEQCAAQKIPFRFCSNTSKEGRIHLENRLRNMGFELQDTRGLGETGSGREMWTSLGALSSHLRRRGLVRPFCLLEPSSKDEVLSGLGEANAADTTDYDSVVVGLAPSLFTYEHLNTAFRVLLGHKPLIATHRAKYIRSASSSANDSLSLGPGPFVAALENAASVQAEVVGKPSRTFFEAVIDSFDDAEFSTNASASKGEKIVIVGDDIETDLGGGAVEIGLWRVLVKTGKYREGDEHRQGITPPDEVWDTFADFVDSLLGNGRAA